MPRIFLLQIRRRGIFEFDSHRSIEKMVQLQCLVNVLIFYSRLLTTILSETIPPKESENIQEDSKLRLVSVVMM